MALFSWDKVNRKSSVVNRELYQKNIHASRLMAHVINSLLNIAQIKTPLIITFSIRLEPNI